MGSEWTVEEVRQEIDDSIHSGGYSGLVAIANAYADLLDKQASAEPVGWIVTDGEGGWSFDDRPPSAFDVQWAERYKRKYVPLYTHPPAQPAGVSDDARESLNAPPASGDWGKVRAVIAWLHSVEKTVANAGVAADKLTAALPESQP